MRVLKRPRRAIGCSECYNIREVIIRKMNSFQKIANGLLERLLMMLMAVLVFDVLWQVFTRFVMGAPSSWTDELATLLIIWVAMIGASVAFLRGQHLGMDYFVNRCSATVQRRCAMLVHLVVALFAFMVLLVGGIRLVSLTLLTNQLSPALGVKMGYVYLAIPICGLVVFLDALSSLLSRRSISKTHEGRLS